MPLPGLGSLAYVPHGPLCQNTSSLTGTLDAISDYTRKEGASLIRVEPRIPEPTSLNGKGFVRSESTIQPRCTRILEVLEDPMEQLKALPKDARYGVRRAGREGVVAGPSENVTEDLEDFVVLLEETAARQNFAIRPREYYREFMERLPAALIVARKDGRLLAGAMTLTFGDESYYLYGASAKEGDNLYASYLVQFEALAAARGKGATRYDMWGPCQPREGDPLWGVYQFKKKFGGAEEQYVGAHERDLSPLQAHAARAAIKGYYTVQKLRGKTSGPIND